MRSETLSDAAVPPPDKGFSPVTNETPKDTRVGISGVSPLPGLVDIETVSGALGISVRQVRRFVAENRMPFVRIGHLIRFDPAELNRWLDARRSGGATDGGSAR